MIDTIKRFLREKVPGINIINNIRQYAANKRELDRITPKIKCWKSVLEKLEIGNPEFYYDVLSREYNIQKDILKYSKSQIDQDLFVLFVLHEKKNGYFVEFGATNGLDISNTYLLEKYYNWTGIVAEPAKVWHNDLANNRSCNIDKRCVYNVTGSKVQFLVTQDAELSTIDSFSDSDIHALRRKKSNNYVVETVSLNDLLRAHNAPYEIDYLSIDTEGSEYEILSAFDFGSHKINVITVEHNFTENRNKIYDLLLRNGFKRVFQEYSQFDDWYINAELML